ncbi:MAG: prenyltransferase [Pseudomonadota bacterium]
MAKIAVWWRALRPFSFPASVVPALLGLALAWMEGMKIRIDLAILTVIGAVAAHSGANLINDYIDFRRGIDRPGTKGGSGALIEQSLSPKAVLMGSIVTCAVAFACALPLCLHVGPKFIWLIAAGFVAGAGYVLPPFGFKYRALGDIVVFAAFGLGITLGSYVAQSQVFLWAPLLYAIPVGMLVSAILHVNNIRDLDDDRSVNAKTLAGMVGVRAAKGIYAALVLGAYALVTILVLCRAIVPTAVLVLITFPIGWKLVKKIRKATPPFNRSLDMADAATAQLNIFFGLMLIAGAIAWRIIGVNPVSSFCI